MGMILSLVVHSAGIQDWVGAEQVLRPELKEAYPRMELVFGDSIYRGKISNYTKETLGWDLSIVERNRVQGAWRQKNEAAPVKKGFVVLEWRWIVERTFGWLGRNRRLSKDYEQQESSAEAWILLAMSHLMVRRLA
jgi:putative transposase